MSQAPAPPHPMTPYTPSLLRFLAAILLGSLASNARASHAPALLSCQLRRRPCPFSD